MAAIHLPLVSPFFNRCPQAQPRGRKAGLLQIRPSGFLCLNTPFLNTPEGATVKATCEGLTV